TLSASALFDTLLSSIGTPAAPAPAPAPAEPAGFPAAFSLPQVPTPDSEAVTTWLFQHGQIHHGPHEPAAQAMLALLTQASALGLQRLDMNDATHVWSARSSAPGEWRLGRAFTWTALDERVGPWLDTGES
ncbi:hypothetical protein K5D85_03835, partial [Deinococcus sp. RIT780]|nr:hypothetical protein [Deinococcus sp. RIT780]